MSASLTLVPRWQADAAAAWRTRSARVMRRVMRIDRWDVLRDGPLTEARLLRRLHSLGGEAVSRIYRASDAVSAQTDGRERIHAVARGLIKITIDGEAGILAAGDLVFVPCGAVLRVEVIGRPDVACLEAFVGTDTRAEVA